MRLIRILQKALLFTLAASTAYASQSGHMLATVPTIKVFSSTATQGVLLTVNVSSSCAVPDSTLTVVADGHAVDVFSLTQTSTVGAETFFFPSVKQVVVAVSTQSACYTVSWQIDVVKADH